MAESLAVLAVPDAIEIYGLPSRGGFYTSDFPRFSATFYTADMINIEQIESFGWCSFAHVTAGKRPFGDCLLVIPPESRGVSCQCAPHAACVATRIALFEKISREAVILN